jgi:uncharacterized cupredoxin-like copper-binding protein
MHLELVRIALALAAAAVAMLSVACSNETTTTGAAADGDVAVTLQEFSVATVPTTAPAGGVTFDITNNGPEDKHEFVVIKTDLDFTQLPQNPDGSVDEDSSELDVIDEVEAIEPGSGATLAVDLEAGSYALICNIYDEAEDEAHYAEGMRAGFTVS